VQKKTPSKLTASEVISVKILFLVLLTHPLRCFAISCRLAFDHDAGNVCGGSDINKHAAVTVVALWCLKHAARRKVAVKAISSERIEISEWGN
jgi:hypothetical protein